jgi:hypothetical protein
VNIKRRALFVLGIALIIIAVSLTVFPEPIERYLFLSRGEGTMNAMTKPEELQAARESIADYFGTVNRTFSLQELFEWQNAHLKWGDLHNYCKLIALKEVAIALF